MRVLRSNMFIIIALSAGLIAASSCSMSDDTGLDRTPTSPPPSTGGSAGSPGNGGLDASSTADAGSKPPPPPEKEVENLFEAPVATGNFVWVANPQSGRVAFVNAKNFEVHTVLAGDGPKYLASVSTSKHGDQAVVINQISGDATLLRATTSGSVSSKTFPISPKANAWSVSPDGRWAIAWANFRLVHDKIDPLEGYQDITVIDLSADQPKATRLSVGYRPYSVIISSKGDRAYAVTTDGISVVELGPKPRAIESIPWSDSVSPLVVMSDVSITPDGTYAIVRHGDGSTSPSEDAGVDSGLDAGTDAPDDALLDSSSDAQVDGEADAGSDAPNDALLDSSSDAPNDALPDSSSDAETDALSDAQVDGEADAGSDAPNDALLDSTSDADLDASGQTDASLDSSTDAGQQDASPQVHGSHIVSLISLKTGHITNIELPGACTDLDLNPDGTMAIAALRETGQIAVIPIPQAATQPDAVEILSTTKATVGSVAMAPAAPVAFFYSNAVQENRLTYLKLSDTPHALHTVKLYAPVLSVFPSSGGATAVAVHQDQLSFSVQSISPLLPAKIVATKATVTSVASTHAGDRALVAEKNATSQIYGAYLVRTSNLQVDRFTLSSPPLSAGMVEGARRGYIAQEHPEGRITFIDLDTGLARTLTGFELGAQVIDGSHP